MNCDSRGAAYFTARCGVGVRRPAFSDPMHADTSPDVSSVRSTGYGALPVASAACDRVRSRTAPEVR